jgi:hypothetical protein
MADELNTLARDLIIGDRTLITNPISSKRSRLLERRMVYR